MSQLNVYISHAPADEEPLKKLLEWLKPVELKYGLKIWYNVPVKPAVPRPLPWKLLLWFAPEDKPYSYPWHPTQREHIQKADIYIFLISHHTLATNWIEDREIIPAVNRYLRLGPSRVRIHSVLLSPSQWEDHSRLSSFTSLGPKKPLSEQDSEHEGYVLIVRQLEKIVNELLRNKLERTHLLSKTSGAELISEDDAFQSDADDYGPPDPSTKVQQDFPFPAWSGWMLIFFIFWLTYMYFEPRLFKPEPYRPRYAEPSYRRPAELPRELPLSPSTISTPFRDTTEYPRLQGIEPD